MRGDGIMNQPYFIAVEGVIGVGKTSFSEILANHYQFHHLKEIVDENPFLEKFYDDIHEWSFQTEMFFLCNRYKQLDDIQKLHLSKETSVVADYHVLKNLIFAKQTLPHNEFSKYIEIFKILMNDRPTPNMIVFLDADIETVSKRIQKRGRSFEQNMDLNYLENLIHDYRLNLDIFQKNNPHVPIVRFNANNLDFVEDSNHREFMLKIVDEEVRKIVQIPILNKQDIYV